MTLNVYTLSLEVIAVIIRFYKIAAKLTVVLLFAIFVANKFLMQIMQKLLVENFEVPQIEQSILQFILLKQTTVVCILWDLLFSGSNFMHVNGDINSDTVIEQSCTYSMNT